MSSSKNKEDIRANTLKFISESKAAAVKDEEGTPAEPAGKPQAPETRREGETPAGTESVKQEERGEAGRADLAENVREAIRIFITDEPKTKRLHILMRPSTFTRLEEAARADRVSVNEWINQAVIEKLERDEH